MATKKASSKKKTESGASAKKSAKRPRKKKAEPGSRGLQAAELSEGEGAAGLAPLEAQIAVDGGLVLSRYRDPVGGHWLLFAALPVDQVEPTPFQRDLSETHVEKLGAVIDRLDHFFDPIIVVRAEEGYWTPNGHHRLAAVRQLGGKSITALVLPDVSLMYAILALNTEKSPNLKDRSLEVIRMARLLAKSSTKAESEFALEFEEPSFLSLGVCYEKNGRFSGSAYQPITKKVESFLMDDLPTALRERERRAERLLEIDKAVAETVKRLKAQGFDSPYLKAFVVAKVNPVRFARTTDKSFDEVFDQMNVSLAELDTSKITKEQISGAAGYASSE